MRPFLSRLAPLAAGLLLAQPAGAAEAPSASAAVRADVTAANWYWGPANRWSWHHTRQLFPTARVGRGEGPPTSLRSAPRDVSTIGFVDPASKKPMTVGQMLDATHTDGFIVLRRGKIVTESYRNGMGANDPHLLMSVTKSVVGALAGILVERGQLDPSRQVTEYIPELAGTVYGGATIRNLLDMTVSDSAYARSFPVQDMLGIDEAAGWLPPTPTSASGLRAWLVGLKREHGNHGERFLYLTQSTTVLGWAMERSTGVGLAQLLTDDIWSKLGAQDDAYILLDREQEAYASPGLNVTLRDLARFGQMMAQGGRYNGRQIVPKAWIDDIRFGGDSAAWRNGGAGRTGAGGFPGHENGSYRNFWWVADKSCGRFAAIGLGAQMIVVDPVADMVVVKFSSPPDAATGSAITQTQYAGIDAIIRALAGHGC